MITVMFIKEIYKAANNIQVGAMLYTLYNTCISCKSRDWYRNRIVRLNIENDACARAFDSFWSTYLLYKKIVILILR